MARIYAVVLVGLFVAASLAYALMAPSILSAPELPYKAPTDHKRMEVEWS